MDTGRVGYSTVGYPSRVVAAGVAIPATASLEDEPGSGLVVVSEHSGDDRGWGLQNELTNGGGATVLDRDAACS
jgi:hypothetical protein